MQKNSNIYLDLKDLREISVILNKRFAQSTKALSSDLKDFVEEIDTLSKSKSYVQSRATKISVSLNVYYVSTK